MNPEKSPHLTPDIVTDEQLLVEAMEGMLIEHPEMDRHRRRIVRHQKGLQRLADGEAWKTYLRVEEATNIRYDLALRVVAKWAFEQGRRCPR